MFVLHKMQFDQYVVFIDHLLFNLLFFIQFGLFFFIPQVIFMLSIASLDSQRLITKLLDIAAINRRVNPAIIQNIPLAKIR